MHKLASIVATAAFSQIVFLVSRKQIAAAEARRKSELHNAFNNGFVDGYETGQKFSNATNAMAPALRSVQKD